MKWTLLRGAAAASGACALLALSGHAIAGPHDALITKHASAHGVPETLVRRVIHIESKGNPRIISNGNYGLMQIRLGTAKSMGYKGTAEGLLDADTNMTYAVKYLASAYRAAGCSEDRAVSYYQRGFYKKPVSKCAVPQSANVQVAGKDSAPAATFAIRRSRSSIAERDAALPPDVLRPKVVHVETFGRPTTPNAPPLQLASAHAAATAPVETRPSGVQLPQSPPLPVAAKRPAVTPPPETTMAKGSETEEVWPPPVPPEPSLVSMQPMPKPRPAKAPKAFEMQMAKLDPEAVPLPLPQPKPELAATPERESKPARRASHRHVRSTPKTAEPSGLLALFQKLTPLTQPAPPPRRRR